MGLLPLLLVSCAGVLLGCSVFATVALLSRASIVRGVRDLVASTMKAHADELIGQARAQLSEEAKAASDALIQLKSERGRVMALLRHRGRAASGASEEEEEGDEGGEPGFLDGLAQSLGVDVERLAAGDQGELAKVQAALGKLAPAQQAAPPAVYL